MSRFKGFFTLRNFITTSGASGLFIFAQCHHNKRDDNNMFSSPSSINSSGSFPKWDYNWDRRENRVAHHECRHSKHFNNCCTCEVEPKVPSATRHIVLIRHGQYNSLGKSDDEHGLTELGREQAKILGQRLQSMDCKFKGIHYSSLKRAKQTAKIAYDEIKQETEFLEDPLLKEGDPCLPDPLPTTLKLEHFTPHELYEDGARIEAAFRKYFHRADPEQEFDSVEVLICHGNVIRYFVCRSLQIPGEYWLRFHLKSLKHTSITVLTICPNGQIRLTAYGDSSHLPQEKLTFT